MILLTGGNGLLGTELQKLIGVTAPSSKQLDITKEIFRNKSVKMVIHCAAYTDVKKAETDIDKCSEVNIMGTANLAYVYRKVPFVYISSEYAKNPINIYSMTKRAGEEVVKAICRKYLIIRTLFKPRPFPWNEVFTDQFTQGDYVDVIAELIVKEIRKWNKKNKIIYVGTGRKTMWDLAIKTRKELRPISVDDIKGVKIPRDYR